MCGCSQPKPCGCVPTFTGCKEKDISTDCILYTGDTLTCSGIQTDTILTDVIRQLDEFICTKFADFSGFITLQNVGGEAGVYKGDDNQGRKLLRTLVSATTNLTITEKADTIEFELTDIYTESGSLNAGTGILTFTRSDETTFQVNLSALLADIYTSSGVLNATTGVATFTRNNASTYTLDLSALIQVQANVLETSTVSKSFIQNKNPQKTTNNTTQYTVQASDNNYVIELNNGSNNITVIIPPTGLPTDNFFVGFVQKGTGTVTFSGYDIKPIDMSPIIYGQGHNAALEIIGGTKYIFGNLLEE